MRRLSYLLMAVLLMVGTSCSKDNDDMPNISAIDGVHYTEEAGKVTLSWESIENAVAYQVFCNEKAISNLPITSTTFVFDALGEDTNIRVEAYADAEMNTKIGEAVIEYYAIHTISGMIWSTSDEGVKIEWDALEGAQAYTVVINNLPSTTKNSTENFVVFNALSDQDIVKVMAYKEAEMKICIGTGVITYVTPKAMSGIVIQNENEKYTVAWNEVNGAKAYNVFVDEVAVSETAITSTSYQIDGLGESQIVRVAAYIDEAMKMSIGEGNVTVVTANDMADFAIRNENDKFNLSWGEVENAVAYMVYVNEEKASEQALTETSFELTGLNDGDVVSVKAFYDASMNVEIGYGKATYLDVVEITVTQNGYSERMKALYLSFKALDGEYSYELQYSTSENGPFEIGDEEELEKTGEYDMIWTLYLDRKELNLIDNTTYYFKVVAKDITTGAIVGESKVVSDELTPETPVVDPDRPTITSLTRDGDTLTIKWNKAANADSYQVYYNTVPKVNAYITRVGNETTGTSQEHYDDYSKNVVYYYVVKAKSNTGGYTYSEFKPFTW